MGWDKIREQRFEKQKELGFWPSNMTGPGRIPPNQVLDSLTGDQKSYAAKVLAVHSAMIEYMDQNIGRVIQYLKDTGQYDNPFIMFTSDNGRSEPIEVYDFKSASGVDLTHAKQFVAGINNSLSNLGNPNSDFNYGAWGTYLAVSPLSGFKTSFYEGGTRPPAIIKAPQSSPSSTPDGNLIKSFVYVTDITPTVLDLAGVPHPSSYKGHACMKVYVVLKVEVNAAAVFGEDLPKQEILEVWKGEEHLKLKVEALASTFLDNSRRYEIVIEEWEVKE